MPPPKTHYSSRTTANGFDPATLSDNDDDDTDDSRSMTSSKQALDTPVLGFTDGAIALNSPDLLDWKISRIGGKPVFPPLSKAPPADSAQCQHCGHQMPLVAQIYCPLETSALERVIYTFSCARKICRQKAGSTRAWRANVVWAEALEQQQRKEKQKELQARAREDAEGAAGAAGGNKVQLDLGSLIFGGLPNTTSATSTAAASSPFSSHPQSSAPPVLAASSTLANVNRVNTNPFATTLPAPAAAVNPFAPATAATALASNPFTPAVPLPSPTPPPEPQAPISSAALSAPLTWPTPAESATTTTRFRPEYLTTAYEPAGPKSSGTDSTNTAGVTHGISSLAGRSNGPRRVDGDDEVGGGAGGGRGTAADDGSVDLEEEESDRYGHRREGKGSGGRRKKGAPSKSSQGQDKRAGSAPASSGAEAGWAGESYEVQRVEGVDDVFLAFQARVDREPSQLLRYHHEGTPLPFSAASAPTRQLFPAKTQGSTTGPYDRSQLPRCRSCGRASTFELELMPNLVAVLNRHRSQSAGSDDDGLDWATVWILSCVDECTDVAVSSGLDEAWKEEQVLVEWEE